LAPKVPGAASPERASGARPRGGFGNAFGSSHQDTPTTPLHGRNCRCFREKSLRSVSGPARPCGYFWLPGDSAGGHRQARTPAPCPHPTPYWASRPLRPQRHPGEDRPAGPAGSKGRIGACAVSRTARSGLARTLSLNRWARHRAIRAEHAAIALLWTQRRAAADTFVEELAGINRHGFRFGGSAMRASDNAFKDHGAYLCTSPRYSITICPSTVGSGHLRR
jgi:hypothetical protein